MVRRRATTTELRNIINNLREKPLPITKLAKNVSKSQHSRIFLDGLAFLLSTGLVVMYRGNRDTKYYKINGY